MRIARLRNSRQKSQKRMVTKVTVAMFYVENYMTIGLRISRCGAAVGYICLHRTQIGKKQLSKSQPEWTMLMKTIKDKTISAKLSDEAADGESKCQQEERRHSKLSWKVCGQMKEQQAKHEEEQKTADGNWKLARTRRRSKLRRLLANRRRAKEKLPKWSEVFGSSSPRKARPQESNEDGSANLHEARKFKCLSHSLRCSTHDLRGKQAQSKVWNWRCITFRKSHRCTSWLTMLEEVLLEKWLN